MLLLNVVFEISIRFQRAFLYDDYILLVQQWIYGGSKYYFGKLLKKNTIWKDSIFKAYFKAPLATIHHAQAQLLKLKGIYNGRYCVHVSIVSIMFSLRMRYGTVFECIFTQKYSKIIIIKKPGLIYRYKYDARALLQLSNYNQTNALLQKITKIPTYIYVLICYLAICGLYSCMNIVRDSHTELITMYNRARLFGLLQIDTLMVLF